MVLSASADVLERFSSSLNRGFPCASNQGKIWMEARHAESLFRGFAPPGGGGRGPGPEYQDRSR